MKREIKFRAWDTKYKEMLMPRDIDLLDKFGIKRPEVTAKHNSPDLITMQFTGLKDKNGKEIYEGDIVKFNYRPHIKTQQFYKIEYIPFQFCGFVLNCINDKRISLKNLYASSKIEIIGNIYENSEL